MIELTRLNRESLVVNSDLIKFIESSPDTVLTLINGEKVIVRESLKHVLNAIVSFRQLVLTNPVLGRRDERVGSNPPSPVLLFREEGKS